MLATLGTLLLLAIAPAPAYDPQPWLQDLAQIEAEIASHYANLDSVLDDRHVDLTVLHATTEEMIRKASNESEARTAIDWFLRQLGDGHAYVRWPEGHAEEAAPAAPKRLCERLHYARRDPGGIDFTKLAAYTPLAGDDGRFFPAGILRLSDKQKIGVLRIHLFSETAHPDLCRAVQDELALADDAACDDECGHDIEKRTANLLTAALERQIEALRRAGATAIVADLTGNGGGSDWVEPAARVLAPVPLRSPRLAFLEHPHWRKQLRERLDDVERDRSAGREPKALLAQAESTLREAIDRAGQSCDRSGIWSAPAKRPDCSLVVSGLLYATGILPYAKPEELPADLISRNVLFNPSRYVYREGANRLPLYVLVDGGTGSAAEYFAAMMQDNRAARIIGTPTAGAGCGYTNGGIPATLQHSGGELRLPDCIRLRADGTNEVLSVIPDVLVPWRGRDSRYQRAKRTLDVLRTTVH